MSLNPIFTDDEVKELYAHENWDLCSPYILSFVDRLTQAYQAKLAEQEPIGYLHANGISFLSSRRTTAEQARAEDYNTPLYAHPCVTLVSNKPIRDSQNEIYETQIPDGTLICEGTKNHDVESSNITKLSLSVDTKEAQALLQSYLGSLKGWQLVPKKIDHALLTPFNNCPEDELPLAWQAFLMIAPKYEEG